MVFAVFVKVLSFLRRKEGFLSLVLKHIDTSAMMDVLLRLISCVEPPPLRLETLTVWDKLTNIYTSCTLHPDSVSSRNLMFFSTVAEWREACPETDWAHSPWERWRGRRIFHYFYTNENLISVMKHCITAPAPSDSWINTCRTDWSCISFWFLSLRGSPMHLRLCATSFVWAETRPVSSRRCHSPTLCWLCWNRKSDTRAHTQTQPFYRVLSRWHCVSTGSSVWSSCCRICSQERGLKVVSSMGFKFFSHYWKSGDLCECKT